MDIVMLIEREHARLAAELFCEPSPLKRQPCEPRVIERLKVFLLGEARVVMPAIWAVSPKRAEAFGSRLDALRAKADETRTACAYGDRAGHDAYESLRDAWTHHAALARQAWHGPLARCFDVWERGQLGGELLLFLAMHRRESHDPALRRWMRRSIRSLAGVASAATAQAWHGRRAIPVLNDAVLLRAGM